MTSTDKNDDQGRAPLVAPTEPEPPPAETAGKGIRLRSMVLGLTLALVIGALTPFNNVYKQATPLGGGHIPQHVGENIPRGLGVEFLSSDLIGLQISQGQ